MSMFDWCEWSNWVNACDKNPDLVIIVCPRQGFNPSYFRTQAYKEAREQGCTAHVCFDWKGGRVLLQFCWIRSCGYGIHSRDETIYRDSYRSIDEKAEVLKVYMPR